MIEEEIKHSRFYLFSVFIAIALKIKFSTPLDIKRDYPGASHYCLLLFGAPDDSVLIGSSDDGEPACSAGRPMLAVAARAISAKWVLLWVRYYGGTSARAR